MEKYNKPFFTLFENIFITLKNEFHSKKALEIFTKIMEKGLKNSYGDDFKKGKTEEFRRLVGERDEIVGLNVSFPIVENNKIVYQFLTDPFPNLKEHISYKDLDATYLNFKVKYILGDNWDYKTTKHLWLGDKCSEHIITTKNP